MKKGIVIMNRVNFMLLCCAIVLASLLAYEPNKTESVPLTRLDKSQVQRIYIERQPLNNIHIQKQQEQWHLVSDGAQLANMEMVDKVLELLTSQSYQRFSSGDKNLENFGLKQSHTRIRFNDSEIVFGMEEPLHSYRYVLYQNQIHLINNLYYYLLRSDNTQFIHEEKATDNSS